MYRSVPVPPRSDVAIVGARILPIADADGTRAEPIDNGTIVLADGVIAALGGPDTAIPAGTETIDAGGRWVVPGFIEAHGHLGVHEDGEGWSGDDTNEMTDPNGAGLRALDGIDPADLGFKDALRGGVTSRSSNPAPATPSAGAPRSSRRGGGSSTRCS